MTDTAVGPERHKVTGDVHLLLMDGDRVLFGLRENTGFEDGAYHLPAGHLEAGESVVEALIREAKEEVGVTIEPEVVEFSHVMHNASGGGRVAFFFIVRKWDGEPTNREPDKCGGLAWFPLNALPNHMIDYCRRAMNHLAAGVTFSVYGWAATDEQARRPIVTAPLGVLLCGITGSGKTVLAQALAARGITRLSVDEEVHRLHGRYGIDYPEHEYFDRERPVVETVRNRVVAALRAGESVVLDHGLWLCKDRDDWRDLIESAGGTTRLVYLPVGKSELLRRLVERNQRDDANALTVTPEALDDFFARFEPPAPPRAR